MEFTAKHMKSEQAAAIQRYEDEIKQLICDRLQERADKFPYSDKITLIFANENKKGNVRLERPCIFFISLSIFNEDMFNRIADWLAAQGYMTRKSWFLDENNNNGDIGHIALSW